MKTDASFGIIPLYKDRDGIKVLLVQHGRGHWAFPKGHAEEGESPLEVARRELQEETGITSLTIDERQTFVEKYFYQDEGQLVNKQVTFYPGWVNDQRVTPQAEEILDFGWFSLNEATDRLTFPAGKQVLAELKQYLAITNSFI